MTSAVLVPRAPAQLARATIAHQSRSFALASRLLGSRLRDQTAVIYTWCRRADDAIDSIESRHADKRDILGRLATELDHAYTGAASDPIIAAFGEVARARQIPRDYADELLRGMAMDASGMRYERIEDVVHYSWRVAGVVGLMMTHVFGVSDDDALAHAAHLGIAMQLTNICRDVVEDWQAGRLYLPDDLLSCRGAGGLAAYLGRPLPPRAIGPIARVVEDLLAIADRFYRSSDRGIRYLPWRAAAAVLSARRIYAAIGDRIAHQQHDVTAGRAIVPAPAKLALVLRAIGRCMMQTPRRMLAPRDARIPARVLRFADVPAP